MNENEFSKPPHKLSNSELDLTTVGSKKWRTMAVKDIDGARDSSDVISERSNL